MSDQQPDPWATVEWRTNPLSGEQWGYRKDVDAARAEDARTIADLRARVEYLEDQLADLEAGEDQ